jgi:hypothetical protein
VVRVQCTHCKEIVVWGGHLDFPEESVLHAHFWKCRGLEDALGLAETRSHFTVECRSLLGS